MGVKWRLAVKHFVYLARCAQASDGYDEGLHSDCQDAFRIQIVILVTAHAFDEFNGAPSLISPPFLINDIQKYGTP